MTSECFADLYHTLAAITHFTRIPYRVGLALQSCSYTLVLFAQAASARCLAYAPPRCHQMGRSCIALTLSGLAFSSLVLSRPSCCILSRLSCQLLFCLVWRFDSLSNVIALCNDDSVPWCRQAACHYRSGCAEILGCQLSMIFCLKTHFTNFVLVPSSVA